MKRTILILLTGCISSFIFSQSQFRKPEVMKKAKVKTSYYYEISDGKYYLSEIDEFNAEGLITKIIYTDADSVMNYLSENKYNDMGKLIYHQFKLFNGKSVMMYIINKYGFNAKGESTADSSLTGNDIDADTLSSIKHYQYEYKNNKISKKTIFSDFPIVYKSYVEEYDDNENLHVITYLQPNGGVESRAVYYYSNKGRIDSLYFFSNSKYERYSCNHDTTAIYSEANMDTISRFDKKTIYKYDSNNILIEEAEITLKNNKTEYTMKYGYNEKGLLIHLLMEYPTKENNYEAKYRYLYY